MPKAFDGTQVPEKLEKMNCGGTPLWDYPSECGYRCDACMAMIGSVGQPERCKELNKVKDK